MDQISVNTPTKTPVINSNKASLDNSIRTETLSNNTNIEILANSIKPDNSKDIEHIQSHNWNKIVFNVDSTKTVWEKCLGNMMVR